MSTRKRPNLIDLCNRRCGRVDGEGVHSCVLGEEDLALLMQLLLDSAQGANAPSERGYTHPAWLTSGIPFACPASVCCWKAGTPECHSSDGGSGDWTAGRQ